MSTPADVAIYGGAAGSGKALALDTPIPTPEGWKTMGELVVGDRLYGADGSVIRVAEAHGVRLNHRCFRVQFDDGETIVADAEHLWRTTTAAERMQALRHTEEWRANRRERRKSRATGKRSQAFTDAITQRNRAMTPSTTDARTPPLRTTLQLAESCHVRGVRSNHAVELCGPLVGDSTALMLDPYLLGVWLGDGTSVAGAVTSADPEIPAAFAACGFDVVKYKAKYLYGIHGLLPMLKALGVYDNKHIPREYLRASEGQRLALLQGLMDTDGSCSKTGRVAFEVTSQTLAQDVLELIRSLGMKASMRDGDATLNGRVVSRRYRICWTTTTPVFRLARKLERLKSDRMTRSRRYIVSCVEVPSVPVRCITVTAEDGMFLAGRGMVPTHNSFSVLLWLASLVHLKGFSAVVFRRTSTELTGGGSIWEESQAIFRPLGGVPRQSPTLDWRFPSGALVEFRHLQHEWDVHAHQSKQYGCIVFEEVTQFEESQFWYLLSRARTKARVRAHIRATCNPDPDSFVRRLVDWWIGPDGLPIQSRSGRLRWFVRERDDLYWYDTKAQAELEHPGRTPLSLTFVSARLEDNRLGDPSYRERLEALPHVERERLLGRNWNIRKEAGTILRREWFRLVDSPPSPPLRSVRGWDKAASAGGDWTRGARWCDLGPGVGHYLADMVSVRGTPGEVFRTMRSTADADGLTTRVAIWQDPGQAGLVDVDATRRELSGYAVDVHRASSSKVEYAEQWAVLAERGAKGEGPPVYVQRAPWNEAFFAECDAFPKGPHDDQIDAISCAHQSMKVEAPSMYRPLHMPRRGGLF